MSICQTALLPPAVQSRRNYWLVAIASPVVVAPFWFAFSNQIPASIHSFSSVVLVLLLACTTVTDLKVRKIYNWASYPACGWGLAINFLPNSISSGAIGISASMAGLLGCFALMLVPYALARGGAGDVKLAAAIGSLLGFGDGMLVIAFTYIVAATAIVGWTVMRNGPLTLISAMVQKIGFCCLPHRFAEPNTEQTMLLAKPVPLAGFFAIATLFIVFDGPNWLRTFA